jgi:hypothetical protein
MTACGFGFVGGLMSKRRRILVGLTVLAASVSVDWLFLRTPQPAPLYCLVALGPDSPKPVLVAWHGDAAYLYPNGTVRGPSQVVATRPDDQSESSKWLRHFDAQITDSDGHTYNLHFGSATDNPAADRRFSVWAVNGEGIRQTTAGVVTFSADSTAPPVVRLFGDSEVVMLVSQQPSAPVSLMLGGPPTDVRVFVASLGPGAGQVPVALVDSATAPRDAHPVVRIDFPAESGGPVIRANYVLDQRC